jgi:hypothetical protein
MRRIAHALSCSLLIRSALPWALLLAACSQPVLTPQESSVSGRVVKPTGSGTPASGEGDEPSPLASGSPALVASPTVAPLVPSLAPLAAASLDSDLDTADNEAIQALLDSAELQALLPSDLIHDGGVILYRVLGEAATSVGVRAQQSEPQIAIATPRPPVLDQEPLTRAGGNAPAPGVSRALPTSEAGVLTEPDAFNRKREARSGAQIRIRRVACPPDELMCRAGDRAEVVVRYISRGVITLGPQAGANTQKRRYQEVFQRVLVVARAADRKRWQLVSVGAIELQSDAEALPWQLRAVRLYEGDAQVPLLAQEAPFLPLRADALPVSRAGQPLRIEAQLMPKVNLPKRLVVFAHLVGMGDRAKVALRDDGRMPDRIANDGIFTTRFVMPPGSGIRTLGLELVDGAILQEPSGPMRGSRTVGISLRVQDVRPVPPERPGLRSFERSPHDVLEIK